MSSGISSSLGRPRSLPLWRPSAGAIRGPGGSSTTNTCLRVGRGRLRGRGAIEVAEREGLDVAQFTQCLDNETHRERILQMQQQAFAEGVNGTPTFRVNGEPGGRSLSAILEKVRQAAEAAEDSEGG